MTDTTTSRRALLRAASTAIAYASGAAIVSGGMAMATSAKGQTVAAASAQISPGLAALIAEWQRHDRVLDRFYATTFNPACAREREGLAAIPHVTIPPWKGWIGEPGFWSTDNRASVAIARDLVASQPRTSKRSDVIRARKLIAAVHRRERAIRQVARTSGMDAADKQEAALEAARNRIRSAIHTFPVATLADFRAKLAWIEGDDGMDGDDLLPLVIADTRRLAGEA
jgi:hypothetical protein